MKISFKRILSFAVVLVMILGLLPTIQQHAHAAGTLTVTDANIGLSWTDASNSKGAANWIASGTTVTGTAKGYKGGAFNMWSYDVTTTLTITNNHSDDRTLSFDYSLANGGSVSGIISGTSGSYSETLAAGASATITLTSPKGTGENTLTISGLALLSASNVTSTFLAPENGSYTVDGAAVTSQTQLTKPATEAYALSATPAANYMFFGWWSEASQSYVSYDATASLKFSADPQLKPVFLHNTTALFGVGTQTFADLTEAANFAASSAATTKTVILLNNGTVSGSHTIPAGVTLLIPYNDSNTQYGSEASCTSYSSVINASGNVAWVQPTAYRTLTLAANAKITVNGSIEVSGQHAASNGSKTYCGAPTGPLGWVKMLSGSNITLNSGSNLYSWGYIQGAGTITAKSGSKVYENFQFTDFRGGTNTSALASDGLVFPINQYYVQNIEVATTYEYGSEEHIATSIFMSNQKFSATVKFMGDGGMFVPASGASITKDYIENRDRMQIDVNGDGTLNSMSLSLGGTNINSAKFVLPLTSNITINIHSGTTTANQSVSLLPGAEMTIDQGATLVIAKGNGGINDYTTESFGLIIYDYDEWTYGINLADGSTVAGKFAFGDGSKNYSGQMSPLVYAPGRTYNRTVANDLKDAKLNVNGTIICNGYLYTTAGGGNIMSSGKTGKIVLQSGAGNDMMDFQANDATALVIPMQSAQLKNGDGSYVSTYIYHYDDEGTLVVDYQAPAGTEYYYCATHDCWYTGECEKCNAQVNIKWMNGSTEIYNTDIASGSVPSFDGTAPTKTSDASNHYTFAGWSTNPNATTPDILGAVTADTIYYAVFTSGAHNDDKVEGGKHYCTVCDYLIGSCDDTDKNHKCDVGGEDMVCSSGYLTQQAGQSATCGADGWKAYYQCSCGKYYADDQAKTLIGDSNALAAWKTGDGKISATGNHTPETDDGDCTTAIECSVCGTVTTPAKDSHTPEADDGDCTTAVKCVNCDKNAVEAKSHDYKITGYDEYYSYHTAHYACENDGCNATKVESDVPHDYTYDPVNHKCVCGKTETFTTVIDFNGYVYDGRTKYATTNSYGSDIMYFLEAWGKNMSKREGYNFLGWTTVKDDASTLIGTESYIVTEARTLYALWETTSYTITLMVDDKQYGDVLTFAYGAEITGLPTPEKAANGCTIYTFSGWQEEVPETMPAENLILHATFTTEISHTAGEPVIENEVAATCGADGSYDTVVYCSVCDEELSRKTIPVPATGEHGWKLTEYVWDWVEKPEDVTCTANAACQTCGATTSADAVMTVEKTDDAWCYMPASYKWTAEFDVEWAETQTHAGPYGSEMDPNRHGTTTNLVKIDEDTHQAFCYYCQTYLGEPAPHDQKTVNFAGNCVAAANYTCSCGYNYYGEVNPDVHAAGSILAYTDITDDQHTAYHPCCNAKEEPAPHDYNSGSSAYTCICGDVKQFTVYWYDSNGNELGTSLVDYGAPLPTCPYAPTIPEGYYGIGWNDMYSADPAPETMPANSLYLKYLINPIKYTVTFLYENGETWEVHDSHHGDVINNLAENYPYPDTKVGHTFIGWGVKDATGKIELVTEMTVTGNLTLYPVFEVNKYTLTIYTINTTIADMPVSRSVTLEVSYGTYVMDVLKQAIEDGKITAPNTLFRQKTPYFDGYSTTTQYYLDFDVMNELNERYTMPANDITVSQGNTVYTGWGYYYTGDQLEGVEYILEGQYLEAGWYFIVEDFDDVEGGAWYCFVPGTGDYAENYNFRVEGTARVPYPTVSINGITYLPDAETLEYCANKGTNFIDETYAWFSFDADGKFQSGFTGLTAHPVIENGLCYAENGMLVWHPGFVEVDGELYYFIGDVDNGGNIPANGDTYITRPNGFAYTKGAIYNFANGQLSGVNGVLNMKYYENSKLMMGKGLVALDVDGETKYIYVRSSGQLATGKYWISNNNGLPVKLKGYDFDENGYMMVPVDPSVNGFVMVDGTKYYYKDGEPYGAGLIEVEGNFYYVRWTGEVVVNCEYWVTTTNGHMDQGKYAFDENGVMQLNTGVINGYYYVDGQIAYGAGLIEWNGDIYYVRSNGQVATGEYWPTTLNGILPAGKYTFDEDGKLITD